MRPISTAHLAAARKLEVFEDVACSAIPSAERSACRLLASWVTQVRHTAKGLELELKPHIDAPDTQRRLKCHLAFAAANGFDRPSCPLFVKGMSIRLKNGNVLEMAGESTEVAANLHTQAQRLFLK